MATIIVVCGLAIISLAFGNPVSSTEAVTTLAKAGKEVLALEVQDRIGGRVNTVKIYTWKADESSQTTSPPPSANPQNSTLTVSITSVKIVIQEIGTTVNFTCQAESSYTSERVPVDWSKVDGDLPPGRTYINPYAGILSITNLRISDSSQYICQTGDGFSTGVTLVTLKVSGHCDVDDFKCHNNKCIEGRKRCDGVDDCPDREDEIDCRPVALNVKTYPSDQSVRFGGDVVFQCHDEGPLRSPVRLVREGGRPLKPGFIDKNGSLELFNVTMADAGVYICQTPNYLRYPGSEVKVNLTVQKPDSSSTSSRSPSKLCSNREAICGNGDCIPKAAVCDGNYDCADKSDENMCKLNGLCEPNEFQCPNRKCMLLSWMCDGDDDCGDGSDEENCGPSDPSSPCLPVEFACSTNQQCVPRSFHCDGRSDCFDGSDEVGCAPVHITKPPKPSNVSLNPGDTLSLTCEASGIPTPTITWRLNLGHVPNKCIISSKNGIGNLTCPDMQTENSGAYTCEGINNKRTMFAVPDVIVFVTKFDPCPTGYFNSEARSESECIRCFCFGESTQCKSADLFTYNMLTPLGERSTRLLGVALTPDGEIRTDYSIFNHYYYQPFRNSPAVTTLNPRGQDLLGNFHPYLTLPETYNGNQLTSYGGHIKYTLEPHTHADFLDDSAPAIIIMGKYATLFHNRRSDPSRVQVVEVRLIPENWQKNSSKGFLPASREDIMMALNHIDMILLRADLNNAGVNITDFVMESANHTDVGLGAASLVEECTCPPGYEGLSCQFKIQGIPVNIVNSSIQSANVTECSADHGDDSEIDNLCPCSNGGTCAADGSCICTIGFTGYNCETRLPSSLRPQTDPCALNPCRNGGSCKTVYSNKMNYSCDCPLGFTGDACLTPLNLHQGVGFNGNGYLELPADLVNYEDLDQEPAKIALAFRTTQNGMLLYQREALAIADRGDYIIIRIERGYVVLEWDMGSGKTRLTIDDKHGFVTDGERHQVIVKLLSDNRVELTVDSNTVGFYTTDMPNPMNADSNIYIGNGMPDDLNLNQYPGLIGCIEQIEFMNAPRRLDLGTSAVAGRNTQRCKKPQMDPCAIHPCRNGGSCKTDYSKMMNYSCDCPLGFTGALCQMHLDLHQSVGFNGNGYLELPAALVNYEDLEQEQAIIALAFYTTQNGTLLYQREALAIADRGDYIMIRIERGYVVLEWDMGRGTTRLTIDDKDGFVTDGERHQIIVKLLSHNKVELTVDSNIVSRRHTTGILDLMNADSNIYIGGMPDGLNLNQYPGLIGCIEQIEFMGATRGLDIGNFAVAGRNTKRCQYGDDGVLGRRAKKIVKELGDRIRGNGGDSRSGSFLAQRLAIAVQRGNASSIMGTFTPGTIRGGSFD